MRSRRATSASAGAAAPTRSRATARAMRTGIASAAIQGRSSRSGLRTRVPRFAGPQPIAGRCLRRYECRSPGAIAGVPVFLRSESEPHQCRFAGWKPGTRRRPAWTAPFRPRQGRAGFRPRHSPRPARRECGSFEPRNAGAGESASVGPSALWWRRCLYGTGNPRTVKPPPKSSDRAISTYDVYAGRNRGLRRKGLPHPWY